MSNLAISGGIPIRQGLLPRQLSLGDEEIQAINNLLKNTNILSGFRGNSGPAFYGGEKIQEFETMFKKYFGSMYAYSCNSCTSALQLACGAIGLQPGDEVIVTPWSMSCSATAPMIWGAVPIFADIEHDYFCLDPKSVEEKITHRTKAIIVVDLFGQSYDVSGINGIANKHGLFVIEDAAQAIGSKYQNRFSGTLGTMGVFSFTQGKHLTAGEGGMMISNSPVHARNFSLIRNHADAVLSDMDDNLMINEKNMIGYNMRMTEIQAAILIEQLKKLDYFVKRRIENATIFMNALKEISFITPAYNRSQATHSFYVQPFFYNQEKAEGVHRDKFIAAVKAELQPEEGRLDKGVPIGCGYIRPLYKMPLFQQNGHWSLKGYIYQDGICPAAEKLWSDELFITLLPGLDLKDEDRRDIVDAFIKVSDNLGELRDG